MRKILKYGVIAFVLLILVLLMINYYVILFAKGKILVQDEYSSLDDVDCIIVLGAGVRDGRPSPLLEDRLREGIKLYESGLAKKIIVSGDHGRDDYDEVNIMKNYMIENGVPSEDVFMDHAGFSTYDSIYRAKEIFKARKVVIVTQKYHLYRALYIADKLGLEAYGVASDDEVNGALYREFREVLARNKDVVKCIFKPQSTYLGEEIPVSGNGDLTNDK